MRPSTSMSHRRTPEPSSATPTSFSRPSSVASHRTASRISQRPTSRLSQRPNTRQSVRVGPQLQALISSVTGLTHGVDGEDYEDMLDILVRKVDVVSKQAMGSDMKTIYEHMKGFSRKARIQSHEQLAKALDASIARLKMTTKKPRDLDDAISVSKLADHLQFLLLLAAPPSPDTLVAASQLIDGDRNPQASSSRLTWEEILKDEPFEGQHWEGAYRMPPGSVVEEWANRSSDSSPCLSPLDDYDIDYRDRFSDLDEKKEESGIVEMLPTAAQAREEHLNAMGGEVLETSVSLRELEILRASQYWRPDYQSQIDLKAAPDINTPVSLHSILRSQSNVRKETYIKELDLVHELHFALQGRPNLMFHTESSNGLPTVGVSSNAPSVKHLSPASLRSLLTTFTYTCTLVARVRMFSDTVLGIRNNSISATAVLPQTLEAFAEASAFVVTTFERFIALEETRIIRAHLQAGKSTPVSLLRLEKELRRTFSSTFDELVVVIETCFPNDSWLDIESICSIVKSSPSTLASRILDVLFEKMQERHAFGDNITTSFLSQVFTRAAEPLWQMLGRWLKDGILVPSNYDTSKTNLLPQEFFIEYNELQLSDPDFWTDGFSLRSHIIHDSALSDDYEVPLFLKPLAEAILGAGKSIGFLRFLGHDIAFHGHLLSVSSWPAFGTFLSDVSHEETTNDDPDAILERTLTTEKLTLLLSDHLLPICTESANALKNVFFTECDFLVHLQRIEDIFLMRRSDVMADFCDILFSAIDGKKLWTDFYFLNASFGDVIMTLKSPWVEPGLVRISYKADRKLSTQRSVVSLSGVTFEYAAPFPLTLVFTPDVLQRYNSLFVLLLQIRRAKCMLDNILMRGSSGSARTENELKSFYVMRSRMSWIVNTLLNFVATDVLSVEVKAFHDNLRKSISLDGIIDAHQAHLASLENLCFLNSKTNNMRRALISILDICVAFSDEFVTYAGDTTLNTSKSSLTHSRRHRSKKQRRERRNIVSYAPISSIIADSSESESEADEPEVLQSFESNQTGFLDGSSVYDSFSGDDLIGRTERMMKDLDALIRYIRREAERLTTTYQTFGVLAFSLQDWDS